MADGCCTYMPELDDVHLWLPSDVLRDIGIADAAERRRLAVVEDLAARLAGVLGGGAPPGEMDATHTHRPQVIRGGGGATPRGRHAIAGNGRPRAAAAPPPYLQAPAAPWHVMTGGPTNNMVPRPATALHQPRQLARAANHPHPLLRGTVAGAAQPPATTRRSNGTGFFLPRTTTVAAVVPPRHANHAASQRQCRAQRNGQRGYEAAAMARRQQELVAQVMAVNVVQMRQLAGAPATTFPELALPQEWAY